MAAVQANFLGRGPGFPLRPQNGRLKVVSQEESIRNSIFLIFSTSPGERRMRPEFGCGLQDLVFRANTPALRGLVRAKVQESLVKWEPRIDVLEVAVESEPQARNHLLIRVDYRLRTNNALFNLVYPFFLQEGVN